MSNFRRNTFNKMRRPPLLGDKPGPRIYYGVIPNMSRAFPDNGDCFLTKMLFKELQSFRVFEDSVELQHREKVLKKLESLFKEWLKETCISMNLPEDVTARVGGKIFPFGSFKLGAHSKGADIDVLCVGPEFVDRKAFFTSFFEKLQSQKEVKDLLAIEGAFVPVMKFTFDGIEIDLLYACVQRSSVPEDINLLDDNLLKGIDAKCVRSLNGYRVTEEVLRSVPNVATFRLALRAIKLWAKRRNIYSNKLGFLGGISWTIMVAKICQLYPDESASLLVHRFFQVFSTWEWPIPVMLKGIVDRGLSLPVWDPMKNEADSVHLMPIITPAYPQQNSTFNVSYSTLAVMTDELRRGFAITQAIHNGIEKWTKLYETSEFEDQYQHFIKVEITATKEQNLKWVGLMEAKVRHLVQTLEWIPYIARAHVNTKSYAGPENSDGRITTYWLIGLGLSAEFYQSVGVNLFNELKPLRCHVYNLSQKTQMTENGVTLSSKYYMRAKNKRGPVRPTATPGVVASSSHSNPPSASASVVTQSKQRSPPTQDGSSAKKYKAEEKGAKGPGETEGGGKVPPSGFVHRELCFKFSN